MLKMHPTANVLQITNKRLSHDTTCDFHKELDSVYQTNLCSLIFFSFLLLYIDLVFSLICIVTK